MSADVGPTARELHRVACPTCGVGVDQECTFTRARRSARAGESMGDSCHDGRYRALEESRTTTSKETR